MTAPSPDNATPLVVSTDTGTLARIWLDAFSSGIVSACTSFGAMGHEVSACTSFGAMGHEEAKEVASWACRQVFNDPAAMEQITQEALNRISGNVDPELRHLKVYDTDGNWV